MSAAEAGDYVADVTETNDLKLEGLAEAVVGTIREGRHRDFWLTVVRLPRK